MALHLTPDILEAAYELLRWTPPFSRWKLPEGEDVAFTVAANPAFLGEYQWEGDHHRISISMRWSAQLTTLLPIMAHEMLHLYQRVASTENKNQHNAQFRRLSATVCKHHGFDPRAFC